MPNTEPAKKTSSRTAFVAIFCSLIIILAALWLFHPIFSPGYLIYRDQPVTYAMARSALTNLFPAGDFAGGKPTR